MSSAALPAVAALSSPDAGKQPWSSQSWPLHVGPLHVLPFAFHDDANANDNARVQIY